MAQSRNNLVYIVLDELNRPISLGGMEDGDTISDDLLSTEVRNAASGFDGVSATVYDNSSTWDEGIDPDTLADLITASSRTDTLVTFSASVETSTANLSTSTADISGYINTNEANWLAGGAASAEGFELWNATYAEVNDGSGNWNNTYTVIADVSANHFLSSVDGVSILKGNLQIGNANIISSTGSYTLSADNVITLAPKQNLNLSSNLNVRLVPAGDVQIKPIGDTYISGTSVTLESDSGNFSIGTTGGTPTAYDLVTVLDDATALNVWSETVDASVVVLDASTTALNVWSGTVDASVVVLDASTTALNVWSGTVDTSVVDLSAYILENEGAWLAGSDNPSGTASAMGVYLGSSVAISGFGPGDDTPTGPIANQYLAFKASDSRFRYVEPPLRFTSAEAVGLNQDGLLALEGGGPTITSFALDVGLDLSGWFNQTEYEITPTTALANQYIVDIDFDQAQVQAANLSIVSGAGTTTFLTFSNISPGRRTKVTLYGDPTYSTTIGYLAGAINQPVWVSDQLNTLAAGESVELTLYSRGTDGSSLYIYSTKGDISHSTLSDLANDDHTQYHNDSRADTWLATKNTTDLANDSGVAGSTTTDALNNLSSLVGALGTDDIANDSTLPGATATSSLNWIGDNILYNTTADVAGTSFPGTPYDGQMFFRTDLDDNFWYDSTRSKWLGGPRNHTLGFTANLVVNAYMKHAGNVTGSASAGEPMVYDSTLVGLSYCVTATAAGSFELYVNGSATGITISHASSTTGNDQTLNYNLAANDIVTVRNVGGAAVSAPVMNLIIKRRAS